MIVFDRIVLQFNTFKNRCRCSWPMLLGVVLVLLPSIIYIHTTVVQSYLEYSIKSANGFHNLLYTWQDLDFGKNSVGTLWRIFPLSAYYYLFNNTFHIPIAVTQSIFLGCLRLAGFLSLIYLLKELLNPVKIKIVALVLAGLFFVYNLYTLTYYASAYIVLLPYFLLPLQLLLFVKGLKTGRLLKYSILLAMISSISFGVNLVYDLIAVSLLVAYAFFSLFVIKDIKVTRAIVFGLLTGIEILALNFWWLFPMVVGSIIDKQTTNYVLNSESFYNLASTAENLLRNLGEWGFFSGYSGVLYYSFSNVYLANPAVIFSGYALAAIVYGGGVYFKKIEKKMHRKLLLYIYGLILLLFPFIGGTNQSWPTHSLMGWAFSHIPYFMALRNTYKWVSLMVLLECLAMGIVLHWYLARNKRSRFILIGIAMLIVINTLPIWIGGLYRSSSILSSVPNYWSQAATYINTTMNPSANRIFMLPDQYSDTFIWGGKLVQLPESLEGALFKTPVAQDFCAGCGQYNTSKLTTFIYQNLNSQNIFKLLGMLGISDVMERNDYASDYYGVQSSGQISSILESNDVTKSKQFGKLDLYGLNSSIVYPKIYSPQTIVGTDDINNVLDMFNVYNPKDKKSSFMLNSDTGASKLSQSLSTDFYDRIFNSNSATLSGGIAQQTLNLKNGGAYRINSDIFSSLDTYRISYRLTSAGYQLQVVNLGEEVGLSSKTVSPLNQTADATTYIQLAYPGKNVVAINIGEHTYLLTPHQSWEELGSLQLDESQSQNITTYAVNQDDTNLLGSSSFKSNSWNLRVSDCSNSGQSDKVSGHLINGNVYAGQNGLELKASADSACVHSLPVGGFDPGGTYLLSFNYNVIEGAPPSFCIWDGAGCAIYDDGSDDKGWQTESNIVQLDKNSGKPVIYLYAEKNNFPETTIRYANVRVTKVTQVLASQQFQVPSYSASSPVVKLRPGVTKLFSPVYISNRNMLENGSFENGLWNTYVGSCKNNSINTDLGQNEQRDSTDGQHSLELYASHGVACAISSSLPGFRVNRDYVVSFSYKVIKGDTASFCIWNGNRCVREETLRSADKHWHNFNTWFDVGGDASSLRIYLYADGSRSNAKVEYDNVSIRSIENSVMGQDSLQKINVPRNESLSLTYSRVNPTLYKIHIRNPTKGLIVFQNSYHPGWRAYISRGGDKQGLLEKLGLRGSGWQIPASDHAVANGYANAWIINPAEMPAELAHSKNLEIAIEYAPQQWFRTGIVISSMAFVGCVAYLGGIYMRRRKHKPKDNHYVAR